MKDQVDALNELGIPATFINSSLKQSEVKDRIQKAANKEYKLLYIAPERLESGDFRSLFSTLTISMMAIDEAHCISQWGHDFRRSYLSIGKLIKELPKRPIVVAFTATATEQVKKDIVKNLALRNAGLYITGFDRANLTFSVIRGENKRDFTAQYLAGSSNDSGIIYASTRKEVDNLYEFLRKKGYAVGRYHAGLKVQERKDNQEAFLYDDIRIMVATNAFGMGIDKSNVRFVIHYNMPKTMESYYQEAGRAGRDGEPSECVMLFNPKDTMVQKYLIEQTLFSPQRKAAEYNKLQEMVDYCYTSKCLRRYILEYFGDENIPLECDNCSNCKEDVETVDITIDAQKIFSCIIRMKQQFGITLVANVLKGSKGKKILQMRFDKLSTYGLLQDYTLKEIVDLINVLIAEGYIFLTEGKFPVAKLKPKGVQVLKGQEQVFYKRQKKKEKVAPDNLLFEKLRALRKDISEKERVPPYVVFSDKTLREISQNCPTDNSSMLNIHGVGETKLKKYGSQFMELVKEYKDSIPKSAVLN